MGTKAIFPLQIAGMSEAGYEEGHDKTRVLIIEAESYFHVSLIFSQNESVGLWLLQFFGFSFACKYINYTECDPPSRCIYQSHRI